MSDVELRDSLLPHAHAHNLGRRGTRLEDRLERVLVHSLDELLVGHVCHRGRPRAADVVQIGKLAVGAACPLKRYDE